MHFTIGEHSWDWTTFILPRKLKDIKIRRYPDTIGISTAVLIDLIEHKTRNIIVKVNGVSCYKTDPKTWIEKGIIAKLTPDQDPHAFLSLNYFKVLNRIPELKRESEDDKNLGEFL